ncbi:Multifunctional alkaline phosphatase superfamily protein [subsurface metagenome]
MKRNIVLIIADQMRADALGYMNRARVQTPNIDALASGGCSFTRAITPSPICGPARCSMFTGLYPHQAKGVLLEDKLGVRTPEERPLDVPTDMMINDSSIKEPPLLTDRLREAGYHTAYAGKWHLGNDCIHCWFDEAFGYDNEDYLQYLKNNDLPEQGWPLKDSQVKTHRKPHMSIPRTKVNPLQPEQCNDAWITDIALDYITSRPKTKPLFLVCGFNGPHPPFKIPEPYFSMYDPDRYAEPNNFHPGAGEPVCKKESFYRTLWRDQGTSWDAWKKSAAVYHGFCTQIDEQVGRITSCLQQEDLLDDTLIIFVSDHGEQLGQHGLWHKMQPYEESLRVPLVMSIPCSDKPGELSRAQVSLIDIPSTILAFAGCKVPESYEGINLLDAGKIEETRLLFSEQENLGSFHRECDWRLVTDGRYKLVKNIGDKDEFYDLKKDPDELENLIDHVHCTDNRSTLERELASWMKKTNDKHAVTLETLDTR